MTVDHPEFVVKIRARDPEAIQIVVHKYLRQILRAAHGAGLDPQHAEDVTQATFATFIEKAEQFEGRSHVRTWLFGILYKKIAEARRELQREVEKDEIDEVVEQRFNPNGSWVRPPQPVVYLPSLPVFKSNTAGNCVPQGATSRPSTTAR